MLQRLAACTVQELGSQEVPGLINGLAGAIAMERARIDGSLAEGHQDLQAAAMQGAVALVVQVTAWLLREEGQLLSLGPEATCTPVAEVGRGAVGSEIALCRGNCHIGTHSFFKFQIPSVNHHRCWSRPWPSAMRLYMAKGRGEPSFDGSLAKACEYHPI